MDEKLKLISMADIAAKEVKWLWYPYIPAGKITILQGDPGEGKAMLALSLAASLTQGLPLPEQTKAPPPATVVYQTAEDGLADTIKPRLEKAGALQAFPHVQHFFHLAPIGCSFVKGVV